MAFFFTLPGQTPLGESHSVLGTRLERDHRSREIRKLEGLGREGCSEEHESNLSSFSEYLQAPSGLQAHVKVNKTKRLPLKGSPIWPVRLQG